MPQKYYIKMLKFWFWIKYFGSEYECTICGRSYRKMAPLGLNLPVYTANNVVGAGYRINARCPHPDCLSTDKERLVYLYLINETNIFKEKYKLLHVAPERNLSKILKGLHHINYLSVDLNWYEIQTEKAVAEATFEQPFSKTLAMTKMDITNIEREDNSFDFIICNHVLEHVQDDMKAMSELYRVLKPVGCAVIDVPISLSLSSTLEDPGINTPERREQAYGQSDHLRLYAAEDFEGRLRRAGFTIQLFNFSERYGFPLAKKYGLSIKQNLYICSKS